MAGVIEYRPIKPLGGGIGGCFGEDDGDAPGQTLGDRAENVKMISYSNLKSVVS